MIDIAKEKVIRLNEVPKILPGNRHGKKINIATVYRWAKRGSNGRWLETVRIGGLLYTSIEALQRFAQDPAGLGRHEERVRHRPDHQIAYARACRELDELGIEDAAPHCEGQEYERDETEI